MINEDQEYYLAGAKHVWWKHGNDGIDFAKSVAIYVGVFIGLFVACWLAVHFTGLFVHPHPVVIPSHVPKLTVHVPTPPGVETYKQYVAQHPMTGIGLPP